MYIETIYHMGNVIEVKRRSFSLLGAPGKKRKQKEKVTSESAKKINQKNKGRNIQRLLLANFKAGDLHIVLQYRKEDRPDTYEDAKKRLRLFIRRIKAYYRERGHELKYIAVTERGKKRAVLHHHIILQGIDDNGLCTIPAVNKCWEGYVKASVMYDDGAFEQLADYLVKAAGKEDEKGATYIRSRNLITPTAEKRIVIKKDFAPIKDIPGYTIIKDSIEDYQNEYGKHQRYLLIKSTDTADITRPKEGNKKGNKKGVLSKIIGRLKEVLG